ncbi:MAG: glycosyltransferase family 4 protein [Pyrinomonadaceae bacterium]
MKSLASKSFLSFQTADRNSQTAARRQTEKFISDKKIRVLRIAHASLTPALRGRERGIAHAFPEVDLEVITPPSWFESGVDVKTVPDDLFPVTTSCALFSKHMQLFAYDPRPIIDALRRHRPHIIDMDHEPYSVACAEILTLRNLYAPDVPIVMQTAQNIFKNYSPPFSVFERRALKQVSAAYMCSETVREILEKKGFQKPMKIVPFGVNLEDFQMKKSEASELPTIGFVGRMLPPKGLLLLADALAEIKDEKWRLLVVGDGEEREKFQRRLAGYGLLERAEIVGAVPYHEIPKYFQQMDVFVMPTFTTEKIREQFGRVLVEAMATGVPVIGSTCGAIPEVVGDAGLIFPEKDSEALGNALRKMLRDADLRRKFSEAGRLRVEQNFTWKIVAEKIFGLYCQVLERSV